MTTRIQIRNPRIASGYRGPYRHLFESIPLEHLFKVHDLEPESNNTYVGQGARPRMTTSRPQVCQKYLCDSEYIPREPLIEWEYDVVDELANWPDLFYDFQSLADNDQNSGALPAVEEYLEQEDPPLAALGEQDLGHALQHHVQQLEYANPLHKMVAATAIPQHVMRPIIVPETTDSVGLSTELAAMSSQRTSPETQEGEVRAAAKAPRAANPTLAGIQRADCRSSPALSQFSASPAEPQPDTPRPSSSIHPHPPTSSRSSRPRKSKRSKSQPSSKRPAASPPLPPPVPPPAPRTQPPKPSLSSAPSSRILALAEPRNKRCLSAPAPQDRGRPRNVWMPAGGGSNLAGGPRSYNVRN
eukprot:EG_transcript_15332